MYYEYLTTIKKYLLKIQPIFSTVLSTRASALMVLKLKKKKDHIFSSSWQWTPKESISTLSWTWFKTHAGKSVHTLEIQKGTLFHCADSQFFLAHSRGKKEDYTEKNTFICG